jgi:hypothetical protein
MFRIDGTKIILSVGDTGAFDVTATGYTFGNNDRALFSIRDRYGNVLFQKIYAMTNNSFTVSFENGDTDTWLPGSYTWDIRYVINPTYDDGKIVDGDQVLTPKTPQPMELLPVVGEV